MELGTITTIEMPPQKATVRHPVYRIRSLKHQ